MCRHHPQFSYLDTSGFRGRNGKLASKFSVGGDDIVHLNQDGIKVYASKFKFALRERHHIPNFTVRRTGQPRADQAGGEGSGRDAGARGGSSNSRGRGRGRGGRNH